MFTTTPTVENYRIIDYLGPVSAQVVIGTGIFAEFFSTWTDFFGARSGSYENKLERIQRGVLSQLEFRATKLGADAVIGLRVDYDEISGSGKSMLMVTAMGTAVKLRPEDAEVSGVGSSGSDGISALDMKAQLHRNSLTKMADAGKIEFTDEVWQFLIENQVAELAAAVLRCLAGWTKDPAASTEDRKKFIRNAEQFFLCLNPNVAMEFLYQAVGAKENVYNFACSTIKRGQLLDFNRVRRLVVSESPLVRARGLQLLAADKYLYERSDIAAIEKLIVQIEQKFQVKAEFGKKKALLSRALKDVWRCGVCGKDNAQGERYCACGRDIYGFTTKAINPEQAKKMLEAIKEILIYRFTEAQDRGGEPSVSS